MLGGLFQEFYIVDEGWCERLAIGDEGYKFSDDTLFDTDEIGQLAPFEETNENGESNTPRSFTSAYESWACTTTTLEGWQEKAKLFLSQTPPIEIPGSGSV
jgi:hypothetical protein